MENHGVSRGHHFRSSTLHGIPTRTPDAPQAMLDCSPQADHYFSDGYTLYEALPYAPGHHLAFPDKSQTYSIEANNAELRHYLARLARRSRYSSRCPRLAHRHQALRLRLEPPPKQGE